jgi:outer membrane protein TolC
MYAIRLKFRRAGVAAAVLAPILALASPVGVALTLEQAIHIAQANDPWQRGSLAREEALVAQGLAAGSLPDPMVSLGFANLPTDTFDFDQEAMTQFQVGVSQVFPRGDSRELLAKQYRLRGEEHPHQREDRLAKVAASVTELWLEAYQSRAAIDLIERDRSLFEQLVEIAETNYTSAVGRTRQQDLIRAQLELTRLDDRLATLRERVDISNARLAEWLLVPDAPGAGYSHDVGTALQQDSPPDVRARRPELFRAPEGSSMDELTRLLLQHPAVLAVDRRVEATAAGIEIAEQSYRPQWRLDASYGYRDDDPMAADRADFFSVGVAFDLPLWTERRQDQGVRSASAATEAIRTERTLLLRHLYSRFEAGKARLARLDERYRLYQDRLLREMSAQAEASLAAYTNDDGDFAEVVRARIAELNARIEVLEIEVERLVTINQLNYLLVGEDTRS